MTIIEAKNLALGYEGRAVISGLSFKVERGDFFSVVGENGAGKTTLARAILGLERPLSGELFVEPTLRHNGIGYLPQLDDTLRDFPASVYEVVGSGLAKKQGLRPFFSAADRAAISEALSLLEIGPLRNRAFSTLSGGERRRAFIARALCARGDILLLDEAAAGLDVVVAAEFYSILERLNKVNGMTIISISHDIAAAARYSTKILHLGDKRALFFGAAKDYEKSGAGQLFLKGGGAGV